MRLQCNLNHAPAAGRPVPQRRSVMVRSAKPNKDGLTYKEAGVDIEAGNELVERLKKLNPEIGGFSGLFPFGALWGVLVRGFCHQVGFVINKII